MSCELQQDAIRELAYSKWEQAGCPAGDGIWFWLEAERELTACQACEEEEAKAESMPNSVKSSLKAVDPPPLKVAPSRKKAG